MDERIGQYRIERKLGEGGVGEVLLAEDEVLRRPVALKRLRPELARRESVVARFRTEAQTLARLNHPNIATLYSFERHGDSHVMVMEYVEGRTASAWLRSSGPMALRPALALFAQALAGIGYAHEHGVVHRDVKGANLVVTPRGVVKVMDFGIARVLGEDRLTRMGQLVGTPEMMSPEQIRGGEVDARSDLYSLGSLLYSLLAGHPPFPDGSEYDVLKAQVETPPPPLRALGVEVPGAVEDLVLQALAKDPAARPPSAAAFRDALAPFAPDADSCAAELAAHQPRTIGGGPSPAVSEVGPTRVEIDGEDEMDADGGREPPVTQVDAPRPGRPRPTGPADPGSRRLGAWAATLAVLVSLGVVHREPVPSSEPGPVSLAASSSHEAELWAAPGAGAPAPAPLSTAAADAPPSAEPAPGRDEAVHRGRRPAEGKTMASARPAAPAEVEGPRRNATSVRPRPKSGDESTGRATGWVIRRR